MDFDDNGITYRGAVYAWHRPDAGTVWACLLSRRLSTRSRRTEGVVASRPRAAITLPRSG